MSPVDTPQPALEPTSPGRVLVVDDVPANVRLLASILKISGFQVDTAFGGQQTLDKLAEDESPDIVLLDVMMPDMDGFEVCRRIRAQESLQHLPIVMVTALHESSARVAALEAGADDLLSKPVDEVEVVARVKSLVRIKRSRDELARAYEEIRQAEMMRENMTAMLVHDLRTPLTGMIMPLEMLRSGEVDESVEIRRELAEVASRSAHRLLNMINDLLDISKMEAGEMQLDVTPVEAKAIIEEAVEQVAPLCEDNRVKVSRDIAPDLNAFGGDDDLLRRVLVNLLGNAIRFAPSGSTVQMEARVERDLANLATERHWAGSQIPNLPEAVLFSVADQGQGIAPEDQERIWDKFAQAENRRYGRRMATGLGLTFCKLAIEAHGGGIWVESQPGQGSNFTFAVPLRSVGG